MTEKGAFFKWILSTESILEQLKEFKKQWPPWVLKLDRWTPKTGKKFKKGEFKGNNTKQSLRTRKVGIDFGCNHAEWLVQEHRRC